MIQKIILATHNQHKLQEAQEILAPLGVTVVGADALNLPDVEETGTTFQENALLKARAAFRLTGLPAIADDSGICVCALNDEPGIYAARYAKKNGGFPAVFDVLNQRLGDNPDRRAYFICAMALVLDQKNESVFIGRMDGQLAHMPKGHHGFGYDPMFIPDGFSQTLGEMDADVKNEISHRAKALQKTFDFLKEYFKKEE